MGSSVGDFLKSAVNVFANKPVKSGASSPQLKEAQAPVFSGPQSLETDSVSLIDGVFKLSGTKPSTALTQSANSSTASASNFKRLSSAQFRNLSAQQKYTHVKKYLISKGIKPAQASIGACQVMLESGGGTSDLARSRENYNGMTSTKGGMATFKSLYENLDCWAKAWINPKDPTLRWDKTKTPTQAAIAIGTRKENYAEDPDYSSKLISMLKMYEAGSNVPDATNVALGD